MSTRIAGAYAAIFSIFNGLFLRPLPFTESDRLIEIDETAPEWNLKYAGVANPDAYVWRKSNSTFDSMAFFSGVSYNLSGGGTAQEVRELIEILKTRVHERCGLLLEEEVQYLGGA